MQIEEYDLIHMMNRANCSEFQDLQYDVFACNELICSIPFCGNTNSEMCNFFYQSFRSVSGQLQ